MENKRAWPPWVESVTHISHFLTTLNSSVNFYVYCFKHFNVISACWSDQVTFFGAMTIIMTTLSVLAFRIVTVNFFQNETQHTNTVSPSIVTFGTMTLSIMTLGTMTLSIMTLSIMTLSIMTLSTMTFGTMTLSIMTLSTMTLNIMTLSIMKLSTMTLGTMTLGIIHSAYTRLNDTQHNDT
jgi:hypothetical protein